MLAAFAGLFSVPAWAQKTDIVTLLNGDRITGEIVKLDRGRLELKTDDAGTIDIEWENIGGVRAVRQFEVVASDGRRFLGSLRPAADRQLLIAALDPTATTTAAMADITSIVSIGASFWKKLDGSFDAGFNYTRSSGIAQTTVNTATIFRRPAFAVRLTGSATLTESGDDDQRDDQGAIELSYARYRGRRRFISGAVRLESNESLGLTWRTLVAGAIGARLVNTNRAQLELAGGLVGNQEQGVDTDSTRNMEGLLSVKSSYYTYDRPKTNLDASLEYYPSLSDWGRQRLQVNTSIRRDMWKDFYAGFNGFYTLDTAPPNQSARTSDVGITLTIGWTY
jgi:hypothetical protein